MKAHGITSLNSWLARARQWAHSVKRDVTALWLAARDPRTPWHAKCVAACVAGYALSPIDLIPDFIPVIGLLDDVIIVPLGILLALRLVPAPLMAEFREAASARMKAPASWSAAIAIAILWIIMASLAVWAFWPRGIAP
jgi:uncharacterized membrane protein YkvA (DUF1232 family)